MGKRCAYGMCKSDSKSLVGSVVFFPFPKPKTQLKRCLRWIRRCGRPDHQLNVTTITKNTYICSKHFVYGKPTPKCPNPIPAVQLPTQTNGRLKMAGYRHRKQLAVSMVKCVVSGCLNRQGSGTSPPRKRFFNFPTDPTRVKVWLAALRETSKQQLIGEHLICEDHFLPEDITNGEVNSDAIPIMPPELEWTRPLSSSETKCSEEQEPYDDGVRDGGAPAAAEPPAQELPQQYPLVIFEDPTPAQEAEKIGSPPQQNKAKPKQFRKFFARSPVTLNILTQHFLELMYTDPNGSVDLTQAAKTLQIRKRRLQHIACLLEEMDCIQMVGRDRIKWTAKFPIPNFLPVSLQENTKQESEVDQNELQSLALMENTLDFLISLCTKELLHMTSNLENNAFAYITYEDIKQHESFQEQTAIIIKAPEDTRLVVLSPNEDNMQLYLKAKKYPIMTGVCEVRSDETVTSDPKRVRFSTLEESRVRTASKPKMLKNEEEGVAKMGPRCQYAHALQSGKCQCEEIGDAEREAVFKHFWQELNSQQRRSYTASLVDIAPVPRRGSILLRSRKFPFMRYHLNVNGHRLRVCRPMFLSTLGVSPHYVGICATAKLEEKTESTSWSAPFAEQLKASLCSDLSTFVASTESHWFGD